MSVRIELDNHNGSVFTCLDFISGKVIMNIPSEETISSITVKLEGISRTRLDHPRIEVPGERPRDKRRAEVEIHRLLYVVDTVFPLQAIRESTTSTSGFTLKAGQYEYPFKIRMPINSACTEGVRPNAIAGGLFQRVSFDVSHGTVDFAKDSKVHVKGTLPPSLSGIAEDAAWIRYFLKVTVNRPAFYKANMRHIDPFVFLPIEPPRPPSTSAEAFAKRKHEFIPTKPAKGTMDGLFGAFRKPAAGSQAGQVPIRFAVEARLPSPPILVPNDPLPLRLLVTKLDPFQEVIVMRSLQITLLGTTHISAHELVKDELHSWLLFSVASIHAPFGDENAPPNTLLEVDPSLWRNKCLPDTIAPTFTTCNISRNYQLKLEIGLSRTHDDHIDILPLLFPIQVYSGIQPPRQLLASANQPPPAQPPRPGRKGTAPSALSLPRSGTQRKGSSSTITSPVSDLPPPNLSPRPHSSSDSKNMDLGAGDAAQEIVAPPPTYEDAIADDIAPVDGPRRRYEQEGTYYTPLPEDLREVH